MRVLINGGSGGVGVAAIIQIAKCLGCYVVAACSDASFGLVESLGADEVIYYKHNPCQNLAESYGRKGESFDLIFDVCIPVRVPDRRVVDISGQTIGFHRRA